MSVSRSLSFLWTPWSLGISILMVLVTAGLCFLAWRRSGYHRGMGFLELLRLCLVGIVAALLNQPEWIEEFRPEEKPSIAVLWDASTSMETRDVLTKGQPSAPPRSRREAISTLGDSTSWDKLRGRMNVVIQSFSPPQPGRGTDLHEPLAQAIAKIPNLRGVVLASDGDWNEGPPPVQAAARLRIKGVPVFTVPVGSPTRLPDIELLSLDAPTFGVAGKSVRVPFTIESALPREYVTTVTLRASDGDEVSKEVRIAPMSRTSDWIVWKPRATGSFTLTLDVPKHPDELLTDNNKMSAPIAIREEKLRVLVVESYPRWEYRYLRNALSRDPGVDVSCLLFHPGLSKVGGGNKDYIKQFPTGLDELSKYDVVFLGDVGVGDGQLTTEQCRLLKGLVEFQASGLVFMPGMQGRQFGLLDTELGDLCPVLLDQAQPGGWGSRTPNHFELTETGRAQFADQAGRHPGRQRRGLGGSAGLSMVRADATGQGRQRGSGRTQGRLQRVRRIPLLATRTFGAGKVLFMGTDGAWRWRKGVEDKYHYRFWGQVVRWMAYQRNMAKGETMRLYYAPDQPKMNQTLSLHANVMDRTGEPLHGGDVSALLTAPSGKSERVRFTSVGDEWGVFTGRFTPSEPGKYEVTLSAKQTGATLATTFQVQGAAAERVGRQARAEVLEEIARVTRGQVIEAGALENLVNLLTALPDLPPSVRRVQLWCHPVVAAAIVVLLGVFWVGRKVIGLV